MCHQGCNVHDLTVGPGPEWVGWVKRVSLLSTSRHLADHMACFLCQRAATGKPISRPSCLVQVPHKHATHAMSMGQGRLLCDGQKHE